MTIGERNRLAGLLRWVASKLDPLSPQEIQRQAEEMARLHMRAGIAANEMLAHWLTEGL